MVSLLLRKEARGGGEAATSYCFASNEATKGRSPSGGFAIALWKPSPDRLFQLYGTQRWQVAAALSAAVTMTNSQETALNFQGQIV